MDLITRDIKSMNVNLEKEVVGTPKGASFFDVCNRFCIERFNIGNAVVED